MVETRPKAERKRFRIEVVLRIVIVLAVGVSCATIRASGSPEATLFPKDLGKAGFFCLEGSTTGCLPICFVDAISCDEAANPATAKLRHVRVAHDIGGGLQRIEYVDRPPLCSGRRCVHRPAATCFTFHDRARGEHSWRCEDETLAECEQGVEHWIEIRDGALTASHCQAVGSGGM